MRFKKLKSILLLSTLVLGLGVSGCSTNSGEIKELKFKDTVSTSELKKYDGETVTITGFVSTSTPLNSEYIYLMNMPYQNCAFCVPNTDSLVNTIPVYAKDGETFEFTDVPVKITGTLKFENITDSMGYSYTYRIKDAKMEKADVSGMEEEIKIYTDLINQGFATSMDYIFAEMYDILNYNETGAEIKKINTSLTMEARDMLTYLDSSKYTEVINVLDVLDTAISDANNAIDNDDLSSFQTINNKVQEAYFLYANWLVKPEL